MKIPNSKKHIKGRVIKGECVGREIGYPTANLERGYFDEHTIGSGVYACRVLIKKTRKQKNKKTKMSRMKGIAIIGSSPAKVGDEKKIEVYILDFNDDIYGQFLEAEIVEKIRDIEKYENTSDLIKQIEKDITAARKIL